MQNGVLCGMETKRKKIAINNYICRPSCRDTHFVPSTDDKCAYARIMQNGYMEQNRADN